MHGVDKFDRENRLKLVQNQVRGHCFKYFKEITGYNIEKITFLIDQ